MSGGILHLLDRNRAHVLVRLSRLRTNSEPGFH